MIRDVIYLWGIWSSIHKSQGLTPSFPQFVDILQRYGEKHRFYHNLAHIVACLRFLDGTYPVIGPQTRAALRMAIIFHDIVYDVKSKTNEEDSAAHARIQMSVRGFHREFMAEVVRLIILTKSHKGDANDRFGSIMIDTDMHVFAEPDRIYASYAEGIRKEFEPAFGREPFVTGRRHFLSTVDPEAIFVTPEMANEKSASQAAWNVAEECRKLAG